MSRAPPASSTSFLALYSVETPFLVARTPTARLPSKRTSLTSDSEMMVRFLRRLTGCRNARAALTRRPFLTFEET